MSSFSYDDLPKAVGKWIWNWMEQEKEEYERLVKEWTYVKESKERWAKAPFPPTFVTTDAIVDVLRACLVD